jgi:hypothetical protein
VSDRVVFLSAAKQGAAKQRVCFEFLGTIRQEYELRGYADQQNVSSFKKFVDTQLVPRTLTPLYPGPLLISGGGGRRGVGLVLGLQERGQDRSRPGQGWRSHGHRIPESGQTARAPGQVCALSPPRGACRW